MTVVISATGLHLPPASISNAELVSAFNAFVARYNEEHASEIAAGALPALKPSSADYIERATGIKARHVVEKAGVLDIARMRPDIPERPNEDLSLMAEMGVAAAKDALARAGRAPKDVNAVICAASNMQRPYPAIGIEIQHALGIGGFAFDMNAASASAATGVMVAMDFIRGGHARSVLVVSPEICSGHVNWRDRKSHYMYGDAATAILVEQDKIAPPGAWAILGVKLRSEYSSAIRNNFGFLNACAPEWADHPDKLLVHDDRRALKHIAPMIADMILEHMAELQLKGADLRRLWLHQANAGINKLVAKRVLGREAGAEDCPIVLDTYANTSSAGAIIAFHTHSDDLSPGDKGLICAFGAGYSAGTVFIAKGA